VHQDASTSRLGALSVDGHPLAGAPVDARCSTFDSCSVSSCMTRHVPGAGFSGSGTTLRARHGSGIAAVRPDLLHIILQTLGVAAGVRALSPEREGAHGPTTHRGCATSTASSHGRAQARTGKSEGGTSEARRSFSPIPALPGEDRLHSSDVLSSSALDASLQGHAPLSQTPELNPMLAVMAARRPRVSPLALTQGSPECESGCLAAHLEG
jgi:hypothetical protein